MRNPSLKARDASDGDQSVLNTMIHSEGLGDVFFSSFAVHLFHFRLELADGTFQRGFESERCPCAYQTQAQDLSHENSLKRGGGLTHRQNTVRCFHCVFSTQR